MLKRFGMVGALLAIAAVAPLTAAAQDRGYDSHKAVVKHETVAYAPAHNDRRGQDDRFKEVRNVRYVDVHNHGPKPAREAVRSVCR